MLNKKIISRQNARGEYKHIKIIRLLHILIIGLAISGIAYMINFVRENIYATIRRAETITLLMSEIGAEAIDFEQLKRVTDAWEKKYSTSTIQVERNPFVFSSPTSTASKLN